MLLAMLLLGLVPAAAAESLRVAAGVYAELGDNGDIGPDNHGDVANRGFIIGHDRVLVIDTGISAASGQAMLDHIRQLTDKPIEAVVLTHATQEFIFGASAFQQQGVSLLAHQETATLMQQRCERCLTNLRKLLGDEAMAGSAVVTPDRLVEHSVTIDLGDRRVDILYFGGGSTPGDLAVFDRRSGALFAGGLVTAERIPNLRDGRIETWLAALAALKKRPIKILIPGFGPIGTRAEIGPMVDYLQQLERTVQQRYRDGASLIEAIQQGDLPAFRQWRGYDALHAQNVLYVYRRIEDLEFQ